MDDTDKLLYILRYLLDGKDLAYQIDVLSWDLASIGFGKIPTITRSINVKDLDAIYNKTKAGTL